MKIQDIIDRILFYISVPKCVFCGEKLDFEDDGLCKSCRSVYESHKTRNCSRCAKPLGECTCSNDYLRAHYVKKHYKIFKYVNTDQALPGNHLIYSLKRDYREDVIDFLSNELCQVLKNNLSEDDIKKYVITSVPRRRAAIIDYGYDHTEELGKAISKKLGIEYVKTLKSNSKHAQKELRGDDRLHNTDFNYISKDLSTLKGKNVFIIDDIVTTGASMGATATLVHGLGARECVALTIASAYNDEYIKREQ